MRTRSELSECLSRRERVGVWDHKRSGIGPGHGAVWTRGVVINDGSLFIIQEEAGMSHRMWVVLVSVGLSVGLWGAASAGAQEFKEFTTRVTYLSGPLAGHVVVVKCAVDVRGDLEEQMSPCELGGFQRSGEGFRRTVSVLDPKARLAVTDRKVLTIAISMGRSDPNWQFTQSPIFVLTAVASKKPIALYEGDTLPFVGDKDRPVIVGVLYNDVLAHDPRAFVWESVDNPTALSPPVL